MKLLSLTWVNIKRLIKNPQILLMLLLVPSVMIVSIFSGNLSQKDSEKPALSIIDEDKSEKSRELISKLEESYEINFMNDKESAYEKIKDGSLADVFYIEKGFEEKIHKKENPKVKIVSASEDTGRFTAKNIIDDFVNGEINGNQANQVPEAKIEMDKKDNTMNFIVMILMMCYFMIISASVIGEDLIKLKKQNIIKRAITTANKDYEVLGGIFLAIFICQSLSTSLIFTAIYKFARITLNILPQTILVILLCSLLSTAVVLAAVRWIKNATMVSLTVVVYDLIAFIISMVNLNLSSLGEVTSVITILDKLSPFYWMRNILGSTDIILSIGMILLMSACFFTAGSFKLMDFVKDN